jgi:hypothetical protein
VLRIADVDEVLAEMTDGDGQLRAAAARRNPASRSSAARARAWRPAPGRRSSTGRLMLTLADVQARLAELTYRPGWDITAYQGAFEGPRLRISALVPDSYNPGSTVPLDIRVPLPVQAWDTVGQFDRWLLWRLQAVEVHECMEWLHGPDGRPLFDPHREHADRDDPLVA